MNSSTLCINMMGERHRAADVIFVAPQLTKGQKSGG
jgi:hypothetical protein